MTGSRAASGVSFRLQALRQACTPEFGYPTAKLVWALRALLAGLGVLALIVEPRYTTLPLLLATAGFGLVASVGFAFIPTRRPATLKAAEAAVLAAFAMHMMGHALGWYEAFWWYDKALHFLVPVAMVLTLYALSQATEWIWNWRHVKPLEVGIYLFSMAVALSALWEILEFAMDQLFGTEEQNGLADTMVDLIADVLGALLGAVAVAWLTRYAWMHGHDEVAETPKRPYPTRGPVD